MTASPVRGDGEPAGPSAAKGLRRSAGVVGVAVLGSRVLGLLREVVFATMFGAGRELDAFIAAFRIPNLLRDLFAEGALSAAFVSTFSQKLEREGEGEAWRLAALVMNDLVLVVGAIVVAGMVFSSEIAGWIAPGFGAEPGKLELTAALARLLFPFLLFVALAAVAMGVLNARSVFGVPASASSFFNVGSIGGGLALAWILAPGYVSAIAARAVGRETALPVEETTAALFGMTAGTLLGGALQFLVQVPSLRRVGFRWRPIVGFGDPGVRQVLRLMGPATIGIAAVQINVTVNTIFASGLGDGAVTWLSVAFRLMYLPIGMFGVAIGTVVLPSVARSAARGDFDGLRANVRESLGLLVVLCVPAAVGLAVLARPIIAVIYEHGRFGPADTAATATALSAYAVGLTGYATIKVLGPAFYALNDAATPMRVSVFSVVLNLVFNWIAIRGLGLGHAGLALSTSAIALWNSGVLLFTLERRVGRLPTRLVGVTMRTLAASAVMAVACATWTAALGEPASLASRIVVVATAVPLGAVIFYGAGRLLGIEELRRRRSPKVDRPTAVTLPPAPPAL